MHEHSTRGITITNYLATGNPEGVIFSYMSNWSGQAIKIPRNLFAASKDLDELQRPGLYLLLGQSLDNPDDKLVYVGEANNLSERIAQHLRNPDKSFAEVVVCFCSKDENLTVSHTKYLEQKAILQIDKSKEYSLVNRKDGSLVKLPPMVRDEMDTYFDNMRVVLPTMGFSILHVNNAIRAEEGGNEIGTLYLNIGGCKATARLTSNGIEVEVGSEMRSEETAALSGSYSNLRKTLQEKGVVKLRGSKFVFEEPYEFSSPSNAAAILLGYSINGRTAWKNKKGQTLKEIEELQIGEAGSPV